MPKGEEKVSQEGKIGKKLVNCIKTYQDDEFVDENILEEKIVEETKDENASNNELVQNTNEEVKEKTEEKTGNCVIR